MFSRYLRVPTSRYYRSWLQPLRGGCWLLPGFFNLRLFGCYNGAVPIVTSNGTFLRRKLMHVCSFASLEENGACDFE